MYLISTSNLIPVQNLLSSNSFNNIPMPIISIAVLILFQKSILWAWKVVNLF